LVRVSAIKLKRFRGIKEGVIDGLSDFTVLVGRNGAGKSTVLEALYLASAWLEPRDPVRGLSKYDYVVMRRGGRGDWESSRDVIWYLMNSEEDIVVGIDLGSVSTEFILHHGTGGLWLRIDDFRESLSSHLSRGGIKKCSLLKLQGSLAHFSNYPPPSNVVVVEKGDVINWFRRSMPYLLDVLGGTVLIDDYLLSRPDDIENFSWAKVLSRRLDKEVVKVIKEEFEVDAEGLTYGPVGGSNVLMLQLRSMSVRVDDLGDGARLATLMMLVVLASKPKLLLIEEPETKMHPRGLRVLTRAVLRIAKSLGAQVIATTHSLEFVKIGLEEAKNLGVGTSLIHLEREADGILTTRKLSKPDVDLLTDLGIDPRFLDIFRGCVT